MKEFKNGEKYIIRTVTMYYVGVVISESDRFVQLDKAAWVADTGRWSKALETGELSEVEMFHKKSFPKVQIASIVDFSIWQHDLPDQTK